MEEEVKKIQYTRFLPPVVGTKLAWAITGFFSAQEASQDNANSAWQDLKAIKEDVAKIGSDKEKQYVSASISALDSTLRTLDIAHKFMKENIKENESLRKIVNDRIEDTVKFGSEAKDAIKALPGILIGSATGVTIFGNLHLQFNDFTIALIGLASAAAGYLVNVWAVRASRSSKEKLLIKQDYEHQMYYSQYTARARRALRNLLEDMDRMHRSVFGAPYPGLDPDEIIEGTLAGVDPTFCADLHKHIMDGKVTPDRWVVCETGDPKAQAACADREKA